MPLIDASHTYKPLLSTRYPMRTWGNDSYTKLLLHCNGTDESTSFSDVSASNHTVTAKDDAQVDTAQKKFGTGSALFDGAGDYLSIADSANWFMDTGTFTIDFWVRLTDLTVDRALCGQYADANNRVQLYIQKSPAQIRFNIKDTDVYTIDFTGAWSPTNATWYHIALIRGWGGVANGWALTVDGSSVGTLTDASAWPDLAVAFTIGALGLASHKGHIDEFRISKGIARWTADFKPPIAQYR